MTIDQLEAFLAVIDNNSFHLAAEELYLSQPSVTSRIKALERELNAELFIRSGRGISLSDSGIRFMPYAKRMLRTYKKARLVLEG
ncbi:LysR family transcriptional regulator [Sporolactobacillus spathodeae]|uniref:DNA-binding transcriptional LysR family regulator n=1 Tax=Sporolactobacillus spathodeae TaxID=1465502 RepID=A0ABS2Q631_9BACL|nr:LysR family transcriptional regulator [Sporolactobacillus spathodeae]MBM7657254.1 DNA-binding transcriptional LysR family regulator [Sporolactobacillus spathodeae]